jgi:hypothetical protein
MKKLVILLLISSLAGCKRPSVSSKDYVIFGHSFSECGGDCAQLFMLHDGKLFRDDMKNTDSPKKFSNQPLGAPAFELALPVKTTLPEFLINSKEERFGCPDCHDQGAIYLEVKEGRKTRKWLLDPDLQSLPPELREYVTTVEDIMKQL